jgi:hypothetical protein
MKMTQTETTYETNGEAPTRSVGVQRLVMRLRLAILRMACRLLLPRDVWIGKHHGAYTRRWDICLGRLDSRGVLQGVLDRDVGA